MTRTVSFDAAVRTASLDLPKRGRLRRLPAVEEPHDAAPASSRPQNVVVPGPATPEPAPGSAPVVQPARLWQPPNLVLGEGEGDFIYESEDV